MPDFLAEVFTRPDAASHRLHLSVQTAVASGRWPSELLYPHGPVGVPGTKKLVRQRIRELDIRLLLANQILQNESCNKCGTPSWLGRNSRSTIGFNIDSTTCYACERLESHHEKRKDAKDRGVTFFPVAAVVDLKYKLPTRRQWMNDLAKKPAPGRQVVKSDAN